MSKNESGITKKNSFVKMFFITFFVVMFAYVSFIVIVDPYCHYHAPISGICHELFSGKVRYINSGIAKNYDYNAVITGSSMTWNFKTSECDELFGVTSIKAPFPAGIFCEVDDNIRIALEAGNDVDLVIRSMDFARFYYTKDAYLAEQENPYYMRDNNIFNDYHYIFNMDVFKDCLYDLRMTVNGGTSTSFDDYSYNGDDNPYGVQAVYDSLELKGIYAEEETHMDEGMRTAIEENVGNYIIDTALSYPDTQFYIFVPPYSIAWWENNVYNQKSLPYQREWMEMVFGELTEIDNIHLFCFWDDYNLICNLDNYFNYSHYGPWVNSYMLECMSRGEHLITKDNYLDYIDEIMDFYENYDYEHLYDEICDENGN